MHLLAMILISFGAAHAQETSFIQRLCQPLFGDKTKASAEDVFKAACERHVREAGCADYFADKDVPMSDRNTCEFTSAELQMMMPLIWLTSCPGGTIDGFFNGPDAVEGTINTAWDVLNAGGAIDQPTALARKHARAEKYRQAVRDQVDFISLPYAEKRRLYDEAQAERDRAYAASRVIEDTLKQADVKLYCYSPQKQTELACYGLGVAVNNVTNLSLIKMGYGGVKWAGKKALKARAGIESLMSKLYKAAGFKAGS